MKKLKLGDYRVQEGTAVRLADCPTRVKTPKDDAYRQMLDAHIARLAKQQELLYASNQYALLVIFQAMDAAGKDSAIKHVMSGVNPQGCHVHTFKHPSATELEHDFLWRTTLALPARGEIGIFNRSYYEEVLIVRVHPEILAGEHLPPDGVVGKLWKKRYRSICDLEEHLHRNGTRILKFFLHVSPEEQAKRLLARLDDPEKHWKWNAADIEERKHWDAYMKAYEDCLAATSTRECPWYVIPADDKEHAHLAISRAIVEALEALAMEYPKLSPMREEELQATRKLLEPGGSVIDRRTSRARRRSSADRVK